MSRSILRDYADPALSNIRQSGTTDPRACGHNPWRGHVVPGAHGRWVAADGSCGVCRFRPAFGTHCFLYETCERCYDEANPCEAARIIGAG